MTCPELAQIGVAFAYAIGVPLTVSGFLWGMAQVIRADRAPVLYPACRDAANR